VVKLAERDKKATECPLLADSVKKAVGVANQIFFASWKRFRNWDAGGPMAERRRDVGRSKTNYDGNKSRI